MPTTAADTRVLCPYYLNHSYQHIHCRFLGGRIITQRFPTPQRRIRHLNRYCSCWAYPRCPLAAIMEAGYRGRERRMERRTPGTLSPDPCSRDTSLENPDMGEEKGQEEEELY